MSSSAEQLVLVPGTRLPGYLSQWYTPRDTAERIVSWALSGNGYSYLEVLEPSAGRGALVKPLLARMMDVTAVDIDPENVHALEDIAGCKALCANFLELEPPEHRFDLAVMNPPFEHGQTERHIMQAVRFADRVVCHCPLTTLAGQERRAGLWSHVQLTRLAICSSRPKYGPDGGKTDMCTIEVVPCARVPGAPMRCDVEWWP